MVSPFALDLRAALGDREPALTSVPGARDASVLIPIVGSPDPTLVFTVRTDMVSSHKGQISFPGGSRDPGDVSLEAAALREAHEELGIQPTDVQILGRLDSVPTYVTGYVIHPFVGWLETLPALEPNSEEVASVMLVPLAELKNEIRSEPGGTHQGRIYPTESWIWQDHVIWGATARIIRLLLLRLASAGLASAPAGDEPWPPDKARSQS